MFDIAIIHHDSVGHTKAIAEQVCIGACSVGAKATILSTTEAIAAVDALEGVDAIVFGSPTYFGSVAADVKQFMDITSKIWLKRTWKNKVAAAFTCSSAPSGDHMGTLMQLFVFAMQHGMIWVGCDLITKENSDRAYPYNESGTSIGLGLHLGYKGGQRVDIEENNINASQYFGARIAQMSQTLKRGQRV